ncbi:outer membrane channel protein TolC [Alginatibacterium sediminis]|uniref:Outer membrane channel protein TolC n=1 Tax=Alginatibacterium sediminis TaxID=2164068 RepID=A0A420ECN9_9ALTE|nr:outer membrane channel protein TolC [Alginatibacterium sediminis]RKF18450.1 outer membrane channel protein TolC [Alginatibacterium sediminis]
MLKLKSSLVILGLCGLSNIALADDILQIYQLAKERDPLILQAKAQRDAQFERITETRAATLPQVGLTAGVSYTEVGGSSAFSNGNAGVTGNIGFSQNLYSQALWTNLSLAEKAASQSDAEYGFQQQSLITRVSQAYFDVLRSLDALTFVRANKDASARQLEQTRQRFNVGLTAITDVHEAQAEYDRTVADEISAENNLSNSYEELREFTGVEHRDLSLLDTERFDPQPLAEERQVWVNQALDKNLNLNAQRIAKDIASEQIDLAQTGDGPSVDLTAALGSKYDAYRDSQSLDGSLNNATVGVEFSLPLYTGGRVDSQVKQAQFSYVAASQALEQSYRSTQSELNSSLNNVAANIGAIKAFEQTVVSSESALEATEAGFEVGTRTIVDVQNATRSLFQSKQQLASARYDYILNMLALKLAAGTLTDDDVVTINSGLIEAN